MTARLYRRLHRVALVLAGLSLSAQDVAAAFSIPLAQAEDVVRLLKVGPKPYMHAQLEQVSDLLDMYGVGTVYGKTVRGTWGNTIALHLDADSTSAPTILYDAVAQQWLITTLGEFLMRIEGDPAYEDLDA
jgi:hypothetical protein